MPIKDWLRNAFATDPPGEAIPTEDEERLLSQLVDSVARREMTTPAIAFLEMSRPLNYIGAQLLHGLSPLIHTLFDKRGQDQLAAFLERRGSIDYIVRRLEEARDSKDARKSQSPQDPDTDLPPSSDDDSDS